MPRTEQEILELKKELQIRKTAIANAEKQLEELTKKNYFLVVDGDKLPKTNGAKEFFFDNDIYDYLKYDINGNLESADRDAYQQWFEDRSLPVESNAHDDMFRGMCKNIDNAIGFVQFQESKLTEYLNSED